MDWTKFDAETAALKATDAARDEELAAAYARIAELEANPPPTEPVPMPPAVQVPDGTNLQLANTDSGSRWKSQCDKDHSDAVLMYLDGQVLEFNVYQDSTSSIDAAGSNNRSELEGGPHGNTPQGALYAEKVPVWLSYAMWMEGDLRDVWCITQFHTHPYSHLSGPICDIGTKGSNLTCGSRNASGDQNWRTHGTKPIAPMMRRWVQVVQCVCADDTGGVGQFSIWLDGVEWINLTGLKIGGNTPRMYPKLGIYGPVKPGHFMVRYANWRCSKNSLFDKVANPDPIPAGFIPITGV